MLVIALSGAGKSHLVKHLPPRGERSEDSDAPFILDADHEPTTKSVYHDLTTRFGHRWWERDDYPEHIRPVKDAALTEVLVWMAHGHNIYLSGEAFLVLRLVEQGRLNKRWVTLWAPDPLLIFARQMKREQAGNLKQPRWTLDKIRELSVQLIAHASKIGVPITTHPTDPFLTFER